MQPGRRLTVRGQGSCRLRRCARPSPATPRVSRSPLCCSTARRRWGCAQHPLPAPVAPRTRADPATAGEADHRAPQHLDREPHAGSGRCRAGDRREGRARSDAGADPGGPGGAQLLPGARSHRRGVGGRGRRGLHAAGARGDHAWAWPRKAEGGVSLSDLERARGQLRLRPTCLRGRPEADGGAGPLACGPGRQLPGYLFAAILAYQFVTIHPFEDGNGRTCRALATWALLRTGCDPKGLLNVEEFYVRDLDGYYEALQMGLHYSFYDSNARGSRSDPDLTPWLEYFCRALRDAARRMRADVEQGFRSAHPGGSRLHRTRKERGGARPSLPAHAELARSAGIAEVPTRDKGSGPPRFRVRNA